MTDGDRPLPAASMQHPIQQIRDRLLQGLDKDYNVKKFLQASAKIASEGVGMCKAGVEVTKLTGKGPEAAGLEWGVNTKWWPRKFLCSAKCYTRSGKTCLVELCSRLQARRTASRPASP